MLKRTYHILIAIMIMSFGLTAVTAQEIPETMVGEMARMINEARLDPAAAAERIGLNAHQIAAEHPDLADIMVSGLPELTWNPRLAAAAEDHVVDMTQNHYYSQLSVDGRNHEQRMMEKGYLPAASGESMGMIQFQNFINPDKALKIVFENLLMEQFQTEPEDRTILNPAFQEFGAAEGAGIMDQDGRRVNAYFVNCLFGTQMNRMETELFHMINQARVKPLETAEFLGLNRDEILTRVPELQDILLHGLPPFTLNSKLNAAANRRAEVLVEDGYFSEQADQRPVHEQLLDFGYQAESAIEDKKIVYYTGDVDEDIENQLVLEFLEKLMRYELADHDYPKVILNPEYKEIGICTVRSLKEVIFFFIKPFYTVIEAGSGIIKDKDSDKDTETVNVTGNIFVDPDGNGFYTPGSGAGDMPFQVYQDGAIVGEGLNSNTGSFNLFLKPGWYSLSVPYQNTVLYRDIQVESNNQAVYMTVDP